MSIEDINSLKSNSIKQTCVVLLDSKNRDFELYPNPNNYVINFNVPFKNVIGFDIIDTSIPRTMYSVDKYNNTLYYYIHTNSNISFENFINSIDTSIDYDPTFNGLFKTFTITPRDYNLAAFIDYFNTEFKNSINTEYDNEVYLQASCISNPTELTDVIQFNSNYPFIFNMYDSTLAETLGFNLTVKKELHNIKYTFNQKLTTKYSTILYDKNGNETDVKINNFIKFMMLYISFYNSAVDNPNLRNHIISPGMVCFTGEKYIIMRSPEIEEHSFGSLAYTNNNLGIAKFRTNSLGFNDEKLYITKIPIREFHPIGKLSKISLRFETANKQLYDFKGINHNITLAIYYFEPKLKFIQEFNSILNPNYTANFNDYKYTNDEQEVINENIDEDEENELFSRDNINNYRKMEQKYNY